jgi:hypothetical protein
MKTYQRTKRAGPAWLLALLALLVAVLVLPARPAAAKAMYHYDFETTVKPWVSAAPAGSKVTPLALRGGENGCPSAVEFSHAYAQFEALPGKLSGAWLVASFPGTGADVVRLSWSQLGGKLCPNCKPILYVGYVLPSNLSQFKTLSPSVTGPARWGDWVNYLYPAKGDPDIPVKNKGTIYVAVGMIAPPVKAAPVRAFGVDCIDLTIFPAP